jgi:hypothetical protein
MQANKHTLNAHTHTHTHTHTLSLTYLPHSIPHTPHLLVDATVSTQYCYWQLQSKQRISSFQLYYSEQHTRGTHRHTEKERESCHTLLKYVKLNTPPPHTHTQVHYTHTYMYRHIFSPTHTHTTHTHKYIHTRSWLVDAGTDHPREWFPPLATPTARLARTRSGCRLRLVSGWSWLVGGR